MCFVRASPGNSVSFPHMALDLFQDPLSHPVLYYSSELSSPDQAMAEKIRATDEH